IAVDSIIARPTNSVRVIVAEASGCCANAVSAVATDRPSLSAGPIHPKLVVMPAVAIEKTAIRVVLSISGSFGRASARGGRNVNCGQDAEDVSLHHTGEQTEHRHEDGKDERSDGQQNCDDHRPA